MGDVVVAASRHRDQRIVDEVDGVVAGELKNEVAFDQSGQPFVESRLGCHRTAHKEHRRPEAPDPTSKHLPIHVSAKPRKRRRGP